MKTRFIILTAVTAAVLTSVLLTAKPIPFSKADTDLTGVSTTSVSTTSPTSSDKPTPSFNEGTAIVTTRTPSEPQPTETIPTPQTQPTSQPQSCHNVCQEVCN